MISGIFHALIRQQKTDLYRPRSDIRNGRQSGRQIRVEYGRNTVKSRERILSSPISSPPMKRTRKGPFSLVENDRRDRAHVQDKVGSNPGVVCGSDTRKTAVKDAPAPAQPGEDYSHRLHHYEQPQGEICGAFVCKTTVIIYSHFHDELD